MSLKTIAKTRWKIEPERITVYPYGLFYITGAFLAIIFAVGYFCYVHYLQGSSDSSMVLLGVLVAMVIVFFGWAGTYIEFDISAGKMRKKRFGFLSFGSIPFSKILAISPVSNLTGSYKYRLFKKDDRYGKGILMSCSYVKSDDENAVAFIEEVVTPIHRHLETHDAPGDFQPVRIDSYEFFEVNGSSYTIKKNRIGSTVLGLALFCIGVHELTPYAWLEQGYNIGRICFLIFTIIGGPAILLAGFTDLTLDKSSRLLTRTNPLGLGNKSYSFDDFDGLQTVRKSTNLIYTGTDVQAYFFLKSQSKQEVIVLQSFISTRKLERFIVETNSIIIN